jgi:hypothetical protein
MSKFSSKSVEEVQKRDVASWFRTVCEVKIGDLTADKPEVLALDYHTPVHEVTAILEQLEIQSVAVYGPAHSFIGAGGVELISQNKQFIGQF